MSSERFAHPEWLASLAAAWLAAALALAVARRVARARAARLLGPKTLPGGWRPDAALLAGLGLIGAALLGPRVGERVVLVPSRGVDLVLLVDVSRSMDAQDVAPSRLARAQRAGAAILAGLGPEDRAALAVFAGRGVLLTPLTPDRDALAELLAGLATDLVRPRGSDLGDGVRRALAAFEPASERPRAVLVLADGEDPAQRTELGVSDALRAEVRVHAAALGSEAGAPIPDHGVPLRDGRGAVVVTRRHTERLARLAAATGGELFAADAWGEIDVALALAAIRAEVGKGPGALAQRRVRAVQVAPLAALAFLLLAGEAALPRRRGPRRAGLAGVRTLLGSGSLRGQARAGGRPARSRPSGTSLGFASLRASLAAALLAGARTPLASGSLRGRFAALLALGVAAIAVALGAAPPEPRPGSVEQLETHLRARPRDPELLVRLGVARLERGQAEAAGRAFAAAALSAREPELAALALYDLGVAQLEAGAFEAARDAFFDALAIAPEDREARFNLEWALRALASRPPPPPPPAAPKPEGEGEEPRRPLPEPGAATPEVPRPGPRPPRDADLLQRWLDRVQDDLGRALRSAARATSAERAEPGPGW